METMRSLVFIVLVVGAFASNEELWHHWKRQYQKEYNGEEEAHRRAIWEQNVQRIKEHNLRHDLGLVTYTLGFNQFTDMTFDEFKAKYLSEYPDTSELLSHGTPYEPTNDPVPASVDWRDQGYVTDVKNQGQCGSCWAFSTTGSVEGQYMKKYSKQKSFSEQQLVDCSWSFGNHGCNGGLMENAFRYLQKNGLEEEGDYSYEARDAQCRFKPGKAKVQVTGYRTVHSGDENKLKMLVGQQGPASVAVDVENDFMMYKGGVYQSTRCSPRRLNHGVLVVGYGNLNGVDHWIVKNSWGQWWGDHGYIRMARNKQNMCGIATMASVPEVRRM